MTNGTLEHRQATWFNELLWRALNLTSDVGEAVAAAELAFAEQPVPDVDEPPPVSAHFSFDISNRKAQGILNRALKAAKNISATARRDLREALESKDKTEMAQAVVDFVSRYRVQLANLLTSTQLASLLEGAREVARTLPPLPPAGAGAPFPSSMSPEEADALVTRLLTLPEPDRERALYEMPADVQNYARTAMRSEGWAKTEEVKTTSPLTEEGRVNYPIIDEAVRELSQKRIVTKGDYDRLDDAARQKAFTVSGVDAQETLEKIRDVMAKNVEEGVGLEDFREKVLEAVGEGTFMSPSHLETVFRANVQTAFSDGQMGLLGHPIVRSGFPYAAYYAIHDDRVRHEHLELETLGLDGTNVYRINDPVFKKFRPPAAYGCRCSWVPMTIRQAAKHGVKEAQQWLESGTEPMPPAFVQSPPFEPPAGFRRSLNGQPLSVRMSLESLDVSLAWENRGTLADGKKKKWVETTTGEHRYQETQPGSRKPAAKEEPTRRAPKPRPGQAKGSSVKVMAKSGPSAPPKAKAPAKPPSFFEKVKSWFTPSQATPPSKPTPAPKPKTVQSPIRKPSESKPVASRPSAATAAKPKEMPISSPLPVRMKPRPGQAPSGAAKVVKRPETTTSPEAAKTIATINASLSSQNHLTDEQKQSYGQAMESVLKRMPAAAHKILAGSLKDIRWHGNIGSVTASFFGAIKQPMKEGSVIGGFYSTGSRSLQIDGSTQKTKSHEVYAHELSHALDPEFKLCKSKEWDAIWQEEIVAPGAGGQPRISKYATTKNVEGWAEFGRLLYGSDVPAETVAKRFPKASAYFKRAGLWPPT